MEEVLQWLRGTCEQVGWPAVGAVEPGDSSEGEYVEYKEEGDADENDDM